MKTRQQRKLYIGIMILTMVVLYSILSLWTSIGLDDWMFAAEWRTVNGDTSPGPESLFKFWSSIRQLDNGRLANVFSPVFSLFSPYKQLFPIITGIFTAFIIWITCVFSFGIKRVTLLNLSLVWLAVIVMIPWRNAIFINDYSLNYIWAAAITASLMVYVIHFEKYGWNIMSITGAIVLSFIAGGWHEGFAVPTIVGFLLLTISKGGHFSKWWYITGCWYGIVTIFFYLCPGMLNRTTREFGGMAQGMSLLKFVVDFFPVVILICVVIIEALIPQFRKYLIQAWGKVWFVIGLGIVTAGTILSLSFTHQPRSAVWPDLMAIVMLFILTEPLWKALGKSSFLSYINILTIGCCLLPFSAILPWQYKFYRESQVILKQIEISKFGTVFHNLIDEKAPLHALNVARNTIWITGYQYRALKEYTKKEYPAVIPDILNQSNAETKGKRLEGNRNVYRLENNLFAPYLITETPKTAVVDLILNSGENVIGYVELIPYMSPDSRPMTYIFLLYGLEGKDVMSINFIKY